MDKVRLGIIGLGGMGSNHAASIMSGATPQLELTAVCDTAAAKIENAGSLLDDTVKKFTDVDSFFASDVIDAVLIATPHYVHSPLAIRAFERNLHVLTEKPAGVYTRQVREMNEAARQSGRVFGIMFNQRTDPLYQKLKDFVDGGELGDLVRTNWLATAWYRSQSYYDSGGWRATWKGEGGGVLINQAPHQLDLWQWICGMPSRVRGFCYVGKYHNIEVEDDTTAFVEYPNGATGLYITTTGEAPGTNRFEVSGDKGKVCIEEKTFTYSRLRTPASQFSREFTGGFGAPESWESVIPVSGPSTGHVGILNNWSDCIINGGELLAPGEDGIKELAISNAIMLSSWLDKWIELPIDEELFYAELQKRIQASDSDKSGGDTVLNVNGTFG